LVPFLDIGPMELQPLTKRPRISGGSVQAEPAPADPPPLVEELEEEMLQRALAASLEDTGRPERERIGASVSAKGKEKVG
jgi:hypothetical protein